MEKFQIVRELKSEHFKTHEVWSEYYDFEELDELRSWGVKEQFINELLAIAEEGASHPFYTVPVNEPLPERMRLFIKCKFVSAEGRVFQGIIVNPNPFVIGIFCGDEIEIFNPNLMDFWVKSEKIVRENYSLGTEKIFPLSYATNHKDSNGNKLEGLYGEPNA